MGTGQSTQRAITAATAAIQALAGGDIKAAIAGGAAPYIANAIPETDLKGRVLAHAVVNAALAAASGRDAASAAAGAAVGELVGKIAVDKLAGKIAVDGFGKQVSELSEDGICAGDTGFWSGWRACRRQQCERGSGGSGGQDDG